MTKRAEAYEEPDIYDTDISDDDYGFILDSNGNLKSVFLPDVVPDELPEKVQELLLAFGITDISDLETPQTLH